MIPQLRVAGSPILLPGWDDMPVDRPRRGRSPWWRRLLAGRAGLTKLQPGSCCGCVTPNCGTCAVPSPLFLTDSHTTISLTGGGGISRACYMLPVGSSVSPCDCYNAVAPSGGGSILISYAVNFTGGGGTTGCSISITRGWSFCTSSGTPYYCIDSVSSCTISNQTCTLLSPPNPVPGSVSTRCADSNIGGGVGCQDSYSGTLTSCTFPQTFTLSLCSNGTLSSPLGASVTLSS